MTHHLRSTLLGIMAVVCIHGCGGGDGADGRRALPGTFAYPVADQQQSSVRADDPAGPFGWLDVSPQAEPRVRQWSDRQTAFTYSAWLPPETERSLTERIATAALALGKVQPVAHSTGIYWLDVGRYGQIKLVRTDNAGADPEVVLDAPEMVSIRDGGHISAWSLSPDGRTASFVVANPGSNGFSIRFADLPDATVLSERIDGTTHEAPRWSPTGDAIYYIAAEGNASGGAAGGVLQHRMGAPSATDRVVFYDPALPSPSLAVVQDGRLLAMVAYDAVHDVTSVHGWVRATEQVVPIIESVEGRLELVGDAHGALIFLERRDKRATLVTVDLATPLPRDWRRGFSRPDHLIDHALAVNGEVAVLVREADGNQISLVSDAGQVLEVLPLPPGFVATRVHRSLGADQLIVQASTGVGGRETFVLDVQSRAVTRVASSSSSGLQSGAEIFEIDDAPAVSASLYRHTNDRAESRGTLVLVGTNSPGTLGGLSGILGKLWQSDIGDVVAIQMPTQHQPVSIASTTNALELTAALNAVVAQALTSLGDRPVAVVATDRGASIVLSAAGERPDLFRALVLRDGVYDLTRTETAAPIPPTERAARFDASPYHQFHPDADVAMMAVVNDAGPGAPVSDAFRLIARRQAASPSRASFLRTVSPVSDPRGYPSDAAIRGLAAEYAFLKAQIDSTN